jgi:uncharacterized protein YdeI (YjbR/CyaY-like superfamily)
MPHYDPRIDAYISKAADFAQPILEHIREVVHETCPDVQETVKWSFPHFEYAGGILCSMAAFKQHCSFGFWLASLMKDPHGLIASIGEKASMGHFGPIKGLSDLPKNKILASYIKEAMDLNENGIKVPKKEKTPVSQPLEVPAYFLAELKQNKAALATFEKFSPSHKKEYVQWITEAKTEPTRNKRMATALEWLQEGKSRHWKYADC